MAGRGRNAEKTTNWWNKLSFFNGFYFTLNVYINRTIDLLFNIQKCVIRYTSIPGGVGVRSIGNSMIKPVWFHFCSDCEVANSWSRDIQSVFLPHKVGDWYAIAIAQYGHGVALVHIDNSAVYRMGDRWQHCKQTTNEAHGIPQNNKQTSVMVLAGKS